MSGDLDIARVVGPDVERLTRNSELTHIQAAGTKPHLVVFTLSREPSKSDSKVRERLLTAIDREPFNATELSGYGELSNSIFGNGMDCYVDDEPTGSA